MTGSSIRGKGGICIGFRAARARSNSKGWAEMEGSAAAGKTLTLSSRLGKGCAKRSN